MTRAIAIVRTFRAQREAVQTIRLPDGAEAVLAIRENFVYVSLMAHVPDKFVLRRVENAMQRDGQLHHSEIRAEMPATFGQPGD